MKKLNTLGDHNREKIVPIDPNLNGQSNYHTENENDEQFPD